MLVWRRLILHSTIQGYRLAMAKIKFLNKILKYSKGIFQLGWALKLIKYSRLVLIKRVYMVSNQAQLKRKGLKILVIYICFLSIVESHMVSTDIFKRLLLKLTFIPQPLYCCSFITYQCAEVRTCFKTIKETQPVKQKNPFLVTCCFDFSVKAKRNQFVSGNTNTVYQSKVLQLNVRLRVQR